MKDLYKALSAFQQECPVIHQDTEGYGYTYANLKKIFSTINPILAKHGLGYYQSVQSQQVSTTVFHIATEQTIHSESDIPQGVQLKGMNDFQVLGSAITYFKRYQISALLGLITDKDIDASGEQTQAAKPKPKSDTKWLNPKTREWTAAVKFLADGGAMADIKKKYAISRNNEETLMDEVLG